MTDREWEVDGARGGSAGGIGGTEATRSGRGDSTGRPANVVPFPGNWFGSVEELVPVHLEPRPSLNEEEPPPQEAPDAAADASDFWEGDAAALEEISPPADLPSSIALLRSPEAAKRKPLPRVEDEPDPARKPVGADTAPTRRFGGRVFAVAVVALAIGLALITARLIPGQDGSHKSLAAHRGTTHPGLSKAQGVTRTVTSTIAVTTSARPKTQRRHSDRNTARKSSSSSGGTPPPTSSSVSSGTSSVPATNRPAASNQASTGSSGGGSGCATQSPDSGCLP